jgi:hypothetical protein
MIDKHLILALYQLARYLLTTYPNLDTLSGVERKEAVEMKAALVSFTRVTECKFNLPHTYQTKRDVKQAR